MNEYIHKKCTFERIELRLPLKLRNDADAFLRQGGWRLVDEHVATFKFDGELLVIIAERDELMRNAKESA